MTQQRTPRLETVDLPDFLAGRVEEHRERAQAQHVSLNMECAASTLRFDKRRIGRALDNLLLNALQRTPANGRVSVRAEQDADELRIVVADTGAGVSPFLRTHLFEPFATSRPGQVVNARAIGPAAAKMTPIATPPRPHGHGPDGAGHEAHRPL